MDAVEEYITNQPFKTFDHVYPQTKSRFQGTDKRRVKRDLTKIPHDKHLSEKRSLKMYMVKIYSNTLNTWFHDLFDNTDHGNPRYWHVFIGVNNRFAVAYKLRNKNADSINRTLTRFINEYHPAKLTSDQESSFRADINQQLCREHKCKLQFVTDKNHSTLGIIDRFMRTLRDMNAPTANDVKQSNDISFRVINEEKMSRLLEQYNNAYHSAIKCTPREMFSNKEREKQYIFDNIELNHEQKHIGDFKLKRGWYVRYRLPRSDGMTKKRTQYSIEQYPITRVKGNMYTLKASDGSQRVFPRFRLILTSPDGSLNGVYKIGETFH